MHNTQHNDHQITNSGNSTETFGIMEKWSFDRNSAQQTYPCRLIMLYNFTGNAANSLYKHISTINKDRGTRWLDEDKEYKEGRQLMKYKDLW